MTTYSLFPSYVQVDYHSSWAPHIMTIPVNQWSPGGAFGTFEAWDLSDIDANDMITAFIADWAGLFTTEVDFDFYTIFNFPAVDEDPVPVVFGDLSIPGTVAPGTISNKAVQATISWQCEGGSILKTVGMDANSPQDFEKVGPLGITTNIPAIVAEITGPTNAWRSRAGGQPLFGKQIAYTLNEKLRRSYHQN